MPSNFDEIRKYEIGDWRLQNRPEAVFGGNEHPLLTHRSMITEAGKFVLLSV